MSDDYHGWRELLAKRPFPIHEDQPLCGFWRKRKSKDGPFQRVAIWRDGVSQRIVGMADGETIDPAKVWLSCARHPIAEADYRYHEKHGVWEGEPPIGHNRPSDPYQQLVEDVETSISDAAAWLGKTLVGDQRTADIAGNKVALMRELAKKATDAHKLEKEPHLRAGQAVDAKYKPMIDRLTSAAEALKRAITTWATAEQARLAEERRKAEAERARIEAENRRREADARKDAELAAKAGKPAPSMPEPAPLPLPPLPSTKVQAGGGVGRKLGVGSRQVCIVTDYAAALAEYRDHPDVVALVAKLAAASFKATKKAPPGCVIREEVKVA